MAVRGPTQRAPDEARSRPAARRGSRRLRVALLNRFAVTASDSLIPVPHAAARVAACLRAALSRLAGACPALISTDHTAVGLAPNVTVDARELDQLTLSVMSNRTAHDVPPEQFAVELLPGWDEEWVAFERDRLRELCLHALEALAARQLEQRQFGPAIATAYAALRMDPLRESAARTLVEIHLAEGNRAPAVRSYLEFRERSLAELGLEPSAEMRALVAPLVITDRRRLGWDRPSA